VSSAVSIREAVQGAGIGRRLLRAVASGLAGRGYDQLVLHVLADNRAAVRLYESEGWTQYGEPFEHILLHRMMQSYTLAL
jgi:ribosomal protein S18 acetylase RimI-like enzyme